MAEVRIGCGHTAAALADTLRVDVARVRREKGAPMGTRTPDRIIHIRRRIDSETLHIPELKGLVGQDVEIIVRAAAAPAGHRMRPDVPPYDFWHGPSAAEQAAAQGVKPVQSIEELHSPELADAFEGFDEALEEWRKEPWSSGEAVDPGGDK
jgi:hypothetical protein